MTERTLTRELSVFVVLGAATLLGIHVVLLWMGSGFGWSMITDRVLLDTDAYSWLNRVQHMVESGSWWDHSQPRISPPDGHEQHWTRPLDALLLAGGVLYGGFVGFRDGLYFWALTLTPLLHLLTLGAVLWAVQPLLRRGVFGASRLPLLILLFLVQAPIYLVFLIGRPDHHALMAFLFVVYLGLWLRVLLEEGGGMRSATALGLVAAAGLWVNVEALIYVTVGVISLGTAWLLGDRRLARRNAVHGMALLAGVVVALAVEWGPRAPGIWEMDTLSIPYLALSALTAAYALVLWKAQETGIAETLSARTGLAALGGVALLTVLYLGLPSFFASPLAGSEVLYAETRLRHIAELQSLPSLGEGFWGATGALLQFAGIALLSLPFLVLLSLRQEQDDLRIAWSTFAGLVAIYLLLAWHQRRWTDYLALSALIPFFLLSIAVIRSLESRLEARRSRLARVLASAVLVLAPLVLGSALRAAADSSEPQDTESGAEVLAGEKATLAFPPGHFEDEQGECSLPRIGEVLADETWFPEPVPVLAHTDHGPSLLFRTPHSVLSIPNHRPQSGYSFMHHVMSSPEPSEAAAMLRSRGVGALVLCRSDLTSGFMKYPDVGEPFVEWLAAGGVPEGFALHVSTPVVRIYREAGGS